MTKLPEPKLSRGKPKITKGNNGKAAENIDFHAM